MTAHASQQAGSSQPKRRAVLGSLVAAASAGFLVRDSAPTSTATAATDPDIPVFPAVTTPTQMPTFCLYTIFTLQDPAAYAATWWKRLQQMITALNRAGRQGNGEEAQIVPGVAAQSLTGLAVAAGAGPRIAPHVSPLKGYGSETLPTFQGDASLPPQNRMGDLLLLISTPELTVVDQVLSALKTTLPAVELTWQQLGFRSPAEGTVARNPFGFKDGIIVPRTREDLLKNVISVSEDGSYSTICVIRQIELDVWGFAALPVEERERVIGRKLDDGRPLSGGSTFDEAKLLAVDPSGEYLIPKNSHVRAAHPSFTGSELMLRRSYGYRQDPPVPGQPAIEGLLFTSFQKQLRTFVQTQLRMDEMDALLHFATARATFTFLMICPGNDNATA